MTKDALIVRLPDGRNRETAGAPFLDAALLKGDFP